MPITNGPWRNMHACEKFTDSWLLRSWHLGERHRSKLPQNVCRLLRQIAREHGTIWKPIHAIGISICVASYQWPHARTGFVTIVGKIYTDNDNVTGHRMETEERGEVASLQQICYEVATKLLRSSYENDTKLRRQCIIHACTKLQRE